MARFLTDAEFEAEEGPLMADAAPSIAPPRPGRFLSDEEFDAEEGGGVDVPEPRMGLMERGFKQALRPTAELGNILAYPGELIGRGVSSAYNAASEFFNPKEHGGAILPEDIPARGPEMQERMGLKDLGMVEPPPAEGFAESAVDIGAGLAGQIPHFLAGEGLLPAAQKGQAAWRALRPGAVMAAGSLSQGGEEAAKQALLGMAGGPILNSGLGMGKKALLEAGLFGGASEAERAFEGRPFDPVEFGMQAGLPLAGAAARGIMGRRGLPPPDMEMSRAPAAELPPMSEGSANVPRETFAKPSPRPSMEEMMGKIRRPELPPSEAPTWIMEGPPDVAGLPRQRMRVDEVLGELAPKPRPEVQFSPEYRAGLEETNPTDTGAFEVRQKIDAGRDEATLRRLQEKRDPSLKKARLAQERKAANDQQYDLDKAAEIETARQENPQYFADADAAGIPPEDALAALQGKRVKPSEMPEGRQKSISDAAKPMESGVEALPVKSVKNRILTPEPPPKPFMEGVRSGIAEGESALAKPAAPKPPTVAEPTPAVAPPQRTGAAGLEGAEKPPKTPTVEQVPGEPSPPGYLSGRTVDQNEVRKRINREIINSPSRVTFNEQMDKAIEEGIPERARSIASEVNAKPRTLDAKEEAGMLYAIQDLSVRHEKLGAEMESAADPADRLLKDAERLRIEDDLGSMTEAMIKGGTELGRAMAQRRMTLAEDLSPARVIARARSLKGKDLTPKERIQFEGLAKAEKAAYEKLTKAQNLRQKADAFDALEPKGKKPTAELDKEINGLIADAARLLRNGCGVS